MKVEIDCKSSFYFQAGIRSNKKENDYHKTTSVRLLTIGLLIKKH